MFLNYFSLINDNSKYSCNASKKIKYFHLNFYNRPLKNVEMVHIILEMWEINLKFMAIPRI